MEGGHVSTAEAKHAEIAYTRSSRSARLAMSKDGKGSSKPGPDPDPWSEVVGEFIYLPPWRERTQDGAFSEAYGPASYSAYVQALAEYRQSKGGGGLWDDSEAHEPAVKVKKRARAHQESVDSAVEKHSERYTLQEMEVWCLYFRDRRSIGEVATELKVTRGTIHQVVDRIRSKSRRANGKSGT